MLAVQPHEVEHRPVDHAMHTRCIAPVHADFVHAVVGSYLFRSGEPFWKRIIAVRRTKARNTQLRNVHVSHLFHGANETFQVRSAPCREAFSFWPVMREAQSYAMPAGTRLARPKRRRGSVQICAHGRFRFLMRHR